MEARDGPMSGEALGEGVGIEDGNVDRLPHDLVQGSAGAEEGVEIALGFEMRDHHAQGFGRKAQKGGYDWYWRCDHATIVAQTLERFRSCTAEIVGWIQLPNV